MLKRTALFNAHEKLGARLVEFGGWEMPVQYTSIIDEHNAVRTAAGVFDISHMGEIFVSGSSAGDFLNQVLTNDIRKLTTGKGQYSLMCNLEGGVVDDLYVYCIGESDFLLIVNASRIEADFAWLQQQLGVFPKKDSVQVINRSDEFGAVAVQGPAVVQFIDQVVGTQATSLKKNELLIHSRNGATLYCARTGYTGEDGFELVTSSQQIEGLWGALLEAGKAHGLKPAGLGARDTLRTEVCYPLYGHELSETISPIEAGVGFFVALDKPAFNGRATLLEQKTNGPSRRCLAFKMVGKSAPPRPDYAIFAPGGGERIGQVTSGTQSPSLGIGIGLGYVPSGSSKPGTEIEIEIRGKRFPAMIVQKPIYKK